MRARMLLLTWVVLFGLATHSVAAEETKPAGKSAAPVSEKSDQMDWLKFWSTILVTLPWPAVILIIAFGFKEEFKSILERIHKLKGFGIETELADARQEAEKESLPIVAASASDTPQNLPVPAIPDDQVFEKLLSIFPASVIPLKWKQVEEELLQLFPMKVLSQTSRVSTRHLEFQVPPQYQSLFGKLRRIRNDVVHGQDPVTAPQAKEFMELADSLLAGVRSSP